MGGTKGYRSVTKLLVTFRTKSVRNSRC